MSSKSTIIDLSCCHIYEDSNGSNGKETFCVGVAYDFVDALDFIEVEANSEFAILMRYLLKGKTESELKEAIEAGQK